MVERDVVGGAAHLWDCIPSKTMIADGRRHVVPPSLDGNGPRAGDRRGRHRSALGRASRASRTTSARARPSCSRVRACGWLAVWRALGPNEVEITGVDGVERTGVRQRASISTGSWPVYPDRCTPTVTASLRRVTATPPKISLASITVIGSVSPASSSSTCSRRSARRSRSSSLASRCCPARTPESLPCWKRTSCTPWRQAAEGGMRATTIDRDDAEGVVVRCDDGRSCTRRTPCWPSCWCPTAMGSTSKRPVWSPTPVVTSRSITTA